MGGDEFAVLVPTPTDDRAGGRRPPRATPCATRSCSTDAPHVDASIGIAAVPRPRPRPVAAARPRRHRHVRGQARPARASRSGSRRHPRLRDRLETLEQLRRPWTPTSSKHYQPKLDLRAARSSASRPCPLEPPRPRGCSTPTSSCPWPSRPASCAASPRRAGAVRRGLQAWRAAGHDLTVAVNLSVSPAGRRPARAGRDAPGRVRRAGGRAESRDHRGRPRWPTPPAASR